MSIEYDVPLQEFIPNTPSTKKAADGTDATAQSPHSYLPDENGDGPQNKTFAERKRELLISNSDALQALARTRRDIKLGHFFRFYQTVELVRSYYNPNGNTYAGMPERFREDLVKNLIEPLCWGYNARILPPRSPPRVQFQTSRFTTRLDHFIYQTPTLPAERKAGLVEGPLLAIQTRHEDYFVYPDGPHLSIEDESPKSEVTGPLNTDTLAPVTPAVDKDGDIPMQVDPPEEAKGSEAVIGTETTAEPTAAELKAAMKDEETKRKAVKREEEKKIRIKKGSWPEGDLWDTLKEVGAVLCVAQERRKGWKEDGIGKGKVEKKIRYKAIGRENQWWDNVFLISSVHSHLSITHVRLSAAYLRFLETGNLPNSDHELIKDPASDWCEFKMRKTKWFDLMVEQDRVEAARAVSGVLAFLERNETA